MPVDTFSIMGSVAKGSASKIIDNLNGHDMETSIHLEMFRRRFRAHDLDFNGLFGMCFEFQRCYAGI